MSTAGGDPGLMLHDKEYMGKNAFFAMVTVIIVLPSASHSMSHAVRGHFSYPYLSWVNPGSIRFMADWEVAYALLLRDRWYASLGFNNAFWFCKREEFGTNCNTFTLGISRDVVAKRFLSVNAGMDAGVLVYMPHGRFDGVYPAYRLGCSIRLPLLSFFGLGARYSIGNALHLNPFKSHMQFFGCEAYADLSSPINRISRSWAIPDDCLKRKRITGFQVAGYSFLGLGTVASIASIPLFIEASDATTRGDDIGVGIASTFGSILLGTGTAFALISIPLFIGHKKTVCRQILQDQ